MKTLKVLLVATISLLCVHTANAQTQCSTPGASEVYQQSEPFPPPCPAGGPNASPYILLGVSTTGTATFTCTSTANAVSPPGPNVIYWSWYEANHTGSEGPQTGFGQMYCNTNNAPYVSYFCGPNVYPYTTTATSPSDYNRFYNYAFSYEANPQNGECPQSGFTQDFEQCPGLACNPQPCPPVGSPPYGGNSVCYSWDTTYCTWVQVTCNSSPILIDVSGNGFLLTSAAGGVSYDISGNGVPAQMAWTAAGAQNAFLCLPDGNGSCNTGKQLFGNFTPQPKSSTPNGFAALAMYDTPASGGNGDGVIDAHDAIFSSLRLWIDANHDGISQPNELFTLPALGITSISLNYKWDQRTDQYGNVFRYRAQVGSTSGTGRMAYDVFFATGGGATARASAKACPPRRIVQGTLR